MGFFDKVTKAVGDVVDKGKKDIDQFMRIQKINGEISAIEAKVAELKAAVQQNSQQTGEKAIALVRAGGLSSPDLQVFVEKLAGIEQQIAAEQAAILSKKADIERIKAEDAAAAPMAPPALPAQPPAVDVPAAPIVPPLPNAASTCSQCGKPLTLAAFCTECGAKAS
jgi:hypothetical protein